MSEKSNGNIVKRNDLFNNSVNDYITMHPLRVDILQEYFIPKDKFNEFITFLQSDEMKDLRGPLLNITLRHVKKDEKNTLNYAKNDDEIALVMFFRGFKTKAFEEKICDLSRKMTDKAQELGRNYYLPYRAYQEQKQFDKGYENKDAFVNLKKEKDPTSKFTNVFWENYLRPEKKIGIEK